MQRLMQRLMQRHRTGRQAAKLLPGLGVAAALATAATFVAQVHGGPQLLYALFFGIALHFLARRATFKPGVEFGSRTVLRLGCLLYTSDAADDM
jgi:uncharacterized membrane protein YadS